jgi:hypothetical protein
VTKLGDLMVYQGKCLLDNNGQMESKRGVFEWDKTKDFSCHRGLTLMPRVSLDGCEKAL